MRTDVHQHLWPSSLVEALRERTRPPMLRGWTLFTDGEAPYEIDPADHDVAARAALERDTRVLVSLSSPLGIEALPSDESADLLAAWHAGAAELPAPFAAWAAAGETEPDEALLEKQLADGFVGLQLSARLFATPAHVERAGGLLDTCRRADRPVLVHPGPAAATAGLPGWWAPVVDYTAQLQAAWWSWHETRSSFPGLRVCFVAGAGLGPLAHERYAARSGQRFVVDPDVYVDTSSHGRQAVDALTRALGIDAVVLGSDRPYAEPFAGTDLGAAALHAITDANPTRLLEGGTP